MNTETQTEVKVTTDTIEDEIKVEAPLFILFAEYLGYVSIFGKIAEEWCDGKVPDVFIQKILIVESKCIFRQMVKDYELDVIREYYFRYYPIIFQDYDDNLSKLIKTETD